MFVRWLALAVASGVLLIAGCGSDGSSSSHAANSTKEIAGDWTGTLHQKGLRSFRVAVQIQADGTGKVAYTGIECGGTWELHEVFDSRPPKYGFTETIDEGAGGACKGSGDVTVQPDLVASNRLHYKFTGGGVTSTGLLHLTDDAGLKPVFDEADVSQP